MQIRNDGRLPVDNFSMVYSVNDGTPSIFQYDQEPILPGQLIYIDLPSLNLQDGSYNLAIKVTDINGAEDQYPEDNFSSLHFVINNNRDIIPLRETFENFNSLVLSDWTIGNPDGDQTWELYSYNEMDQSQAAYIRNFTYDAPGRKDWLVSPILDFRNAQEASMFFSIAHALNPNYPDILEIRVSTDCGISYPHIVYQKAGESLSTLISYDEWFPTSLTGFRREFVNLYRYVGEENVRIAFIATTGYGNNLFIDNIEFFVSANPEPVVTPFDNFLLFPNPATSQISASFNLAQRQDVTLIMYDNLGRTISEVNFPNTLNQTFEFDLTGLAPGIYFIKFQGIQFNNTKRFILK
ncbi:MAG: T9SS type A sorting domain-containing protein [Bacteroidota bacterium]|nr:T9SS type A sorting domain-containing protein [Bacteroidota bacterium]